jgi:preprotein translocase subunit SecA
MERTDIPEDQPIEASMVSKAIETAQRQVETVNFTARKNVLEYDDVMNLQRKAIYEERNSILDGKDLSDTIPTVIADSVEAVVMENCPPKSAADDWNVDKVDAYLVNMTGDENLTVDSLDHGEDTYLLMDEMISALQDIYDKKAAQVGPAFKDIQGAVMLRFLDTRWMAHLQEMDYLRSAIGLRAYGQRDPLTEYRAEAHRMFGVLISGIYEDFLRFILRAPIVVRQVEPEPDPLAGKVSYSNPEETLNQGNAGSASAASGTGMPAATPKETLTKTAPIVKDKDDPWANVGRNDPCPCGSGKKYKKCHGAANNR